MTLRRWRAPCSLLAVAILLLAPMAPPRAMAASASLDGPSPMIGGPAGRPLVFAYYYIWYTQSSWARAKKDLPQLGRYDSRDRAVIAQHIAWAQAAGIDGFIVSWKHQPNLDAALATLVDEATKAGMKLILLYQGLDFHRNPLDDARVGSDLRWFLDTYGSAAPFDVFGKPLIVWSGTWGYTDAQIARVRAAVGAPGRALLLGSERSAAAYQARATLFDGDAYYWSSPDPLHTPGYQSRLDDLAATVRASHGRWIAPAAPGFDARMVGGTSVVERRNGATYRAAWAGALRSDPDVIGIISWNEFSENSHIEPSTTYGTTYLDLTRQLVNGLTAPGQGSPLPSPSVSPAAGAATGAASSGTSAGAGDDLGLGIGLGIVALLVALAVAMRRRREQPQAEGR